MIHRYLVKINNEFLNLHSHCLLSYSTLVMAPQTKSTKSPKLIRVSLDGNQLLKRVIEIINTNEEIQTLWHITNVTAIKRLGMTDHGILHFQIVIDNALQLLRILQSKKINPSVCKDFDLDYESAEVTVALAALLHDSGMSIHRIGHEEYSLFLVNTLLRELLQFLPPRQRTIIVSETLHAIISHRSGGMPLTLEAGIVRVADALDMTKGRSRIPYDPNLLNIHFVSALAIDDIVIKPGRKTPIQIDITMNHTAGLYQVDELLKKKVTGSGIEKYLEVKVYMDKGRGNQLFKDFFVK